MEVSILKQDKDHIEIELNNLTIAELVRNELWQDNKIAIAAWKRDHPTKSPMMVIKVKEGTAKKALLDCIERLQKVNEKIVAEFKKVVK